MSITDLLCFNSPTLSAGIGMMLANDGIFRISPFTLDLLSGGQYVSNSLERLTDLGVKFWFPDYSAIQHFQMPEKVFTHYLFE